MVQHILRGDLVDGLVGKLVGQSIDCPHVCVYGRLRKSQRDKVCIVLRGHGAEGPVLGFLGGLRLRLHIDRQEPGSDASMVLLDLQEAVVGRYGVLADWFDFGLTVIPVPDVETHDPLTGEELAFLVLDREDYRSTGNLDRDTRIVSFLVIESGKECHFSFHGPPPGSP